MKLSRTTFLAGISAALSLASLPSTTTAAMPVIASPVPRYNPLDFVRLHSVNDWADARSLADMLVDPDGVGYYGKLGYWRRSAATFLAALTLHYLYPTTAQGNDNSKSLVGLQRYLECWTGYNSDLLTVMASADHGYRFSESGENGTHPAIAATAKSLGERDSAERDSVIAEVRCVLFQYGPLGPVSGEQMMRASVG